MENFVQPKSNLVPNWERYLKYKTVRKNIINSFSAEIGAVLGFKLGFIVGIALGTELGTALGSEL